MRYYSESGLELKRGTEGSGGLDLPFYDPEIEEVTLQPGESKLIKTGIYPEIPKGYVGFLDTRSHAGKLQIDLLCRTIDSDYRGNIKLMLINHSKNSVCIKRGEYPAQMVILKYNTSNAQKVLSLEELEKTDRDQGSFGHTKGGISNV